MSYWLKQSGVRHVVLDSGSVGNTWRSKRWDSFCLVTPNWQCALPGYGYDGSDPDGFMVKEEILEFFERYVGSFEPPLRGGVRVDNVVAEGEGFRLDTSDGEYTADNVVVATSNYHYPRIPDVCHGIDPNVYQVHSSQYRNAHELPEGAVMVVGTGQSGCQIAEDLHIEGRRVHLCVGRAPRVSREHRGRDVVKWLDQMGHYKLTVDDHPEGEAVRFETNHYVTGRGGGHEINLRDFAQQGMRLYGRLVSADADRLDFEDNLIENLDNADAVAVRINRFIDAHIEANEIDAPPDTTRLDSWVPPTAQSIDIEDEQIRTIIWATGYGMDFSWIKSDTFDDSGYPKYYRGVSEQPGLYFLGLNWLWTWGSGRIYSAGDDAKYISGHILTGGS